MGQEVSFNNEKGRFFGDDGDFNPVEHFQHGDTTALAHALLKDPHHFLPIGTIVKFTMNYNHEHTGQCIKVLPGLDRGRYKGLFLTEYTDRSGNASVNLTEGYQVVLISLAVDHGEREIGGDLRLHKPRKMQFKPDAGGAKRFDRGDNTLQILSVQTPKRDRENELLTPARMARGSLPGFSDTDVVLAIAHEADPEFDIYKDPGPGYYPRYRGDSPRAARDRRRDASPVRAPKPRLSPRAAKAAARKAEDAAWAARVRFPGASETVCEQCGKPLPPRDRVFHYGDGTEYWRFDTSKCARDHRLKWREIHPTQSDLL